MTETTNFGLNLPDTTDPMDVTPLNENFKKIDEALVTYYDLFKDSSGYMPEWNPDRSEGEKHGYFNITEHVDPDEIAQAVEQDRMIRVWWYNPAELVSSYAVLQNYQFKAGDTFTERIYSGEVPDRYVAPGVLTFYVIDVTYHEDYGAFAAGDRVVSLHCFNTLPDDIWVDIKSKVVQTVNGVAPDENGNVEVETASSRVVTAMDLSDWDNGAFTVDYDDGTRMNGTVTFDEAGNPITISDGTNTMTITWPAEVTE